MPAPRVRGSNMRMERGRPGCVGRRSSRVPGGDPGCISVANAELTGGTPNKVRIGVEIAQERDVASRSAGILPALRKG